MRVEHAQLAVDAMTDRAEIFEAIRKGDLPFPLNQYAWSSADYTTLLHTLARRCAVLRAIPVSYHVECDACGVVYDTTINPSICGACGASLTPVVVRVA